MKNLILTACAVLLSVSLIQAQESKGKSSKKEKLHVKLKDGANPDIYVDGKKFDFPIDLLDVNRIESVNVLKGEEALKKYNAKNGIVLIETKKNLGETDKSKIMDKGETIDEDKAPMIIINGEKSDRKMLKKLSPDHIESIKVLKDEQALKKYNAPNGIIIIKTKKGKNE